MRIAGRWIASLAGTVAMAPVAIAAPAVVRNLAVSATGSHTKLEVALSDVGQYRLFTLTGPDRVVLDIAPARLAPSAIPLPAGAGAIRLVRVANRPDGSVRVVLDLAARAEPQGTMRRAAGATGNRLVVDLVTGPSPAAPARAMPATTAAPGAMAAEEVRPAPADPAASAGRSEAPPIAASKADAAPALSEIDRDALAAAPETPSPAAHADPKPIGRDIVIAVDAGHGGKDPGAHGPRGVLEKDVTLRIARRLVDTINAEPGMRGVLTRNRDEFIPLRGRMERARAAQADLFVSIHADAVRNRDVQGASIYVLNEKGATDEAAKRLAARENAADLIGGVSLGDKDPVLRSVLMDLSQNASLSSSIEVADTILDEMARVGSVRKRQVMQAPFMVLKSPDVPSVLIETAYISNPEEEERLDSNEYRGRLAGAIFGGVREYFYKNPPRGTLVAELSRQRLADTVQHVIRRGETLAVIADRYNISVLQIRAANHLADDRVATGQVLRIPVRRDI